MAATIWMRHTLGVVIDTHPHLMTLLELPGVRAAVDAARAALDGAELPVDMVRDLVRGARPWPEHLDPIDEVVRGAIQASVETEQVRALVINAPAQALARLHVAAVAGILPPDQVGRPRQGDETSREFVDLGPAAPAAELPARLAGIASPKQATSRLVARHTSGL